MKSTGFFHIFLLLFLTLTAGCASTRHGGESVPAPGASGEQHIDDIQLNDFAIGIGDTIEITVYRHDDLAKTVKVGYSGKTSFPLIGDVEVRGKGISSLEEELRDRLSRFIVNPQVSVEITSVKSRKVIVIGEVQNPGVLTLDTDISIIEAITQSGGMTSDAKTSNVLLIRKENGGSRARSLDLRKAFKKGDLSNDVMLRADDIVYLPATVIANLSRYFGKLSAILSPIVNLESGIVLWPQVKDAVQGKRSGATISIGN